MPNALHQMHPNKCHYYEEMPMSLDLADSKLPHRGMLLRIVAIRGGKGRDEHFLEHSSNGVMSRVHTVH